MESLEVITAPQHNDVPKSPIPAKPKRGGSLRRSMSVLSVSQEDESRNSQSPFTELIGPRRSGRTKNTPATYNLRVLVGLGREESPSTPSETEPARRVPGPSSNSLDSPPVPRQLKQGPRATSRIQNHLWKREIHGCRRNNQVHAAVTSDFRPWKSWKGASNDVVALAWSPDATRFAAGATAQPDEYNRKYNLLLGDLVEGTLTELPDHWTRRSSPSVAASDERLYTSVTDMQWVGNRLYTASYDNTVKIWDVEGHKQPSCLQTLKHDSKVVVMSLSRSMPNLVATGANQIRDQFRLWDVQEGEHPSWWDLEILRDPRQKAVDLIPTTLAWGHTAHAKHYLVGGMANHGHDEYKVSQFGHLGMWQMAEAAPIARKMSPDSQNVFDIKWHHSLPKFAAATTYSQAMHLPYKTRTVVQVYNCASNDFRVTSRFSCTAADINETDFCPMDSSYISASCTDGRTYVWDARNPDKPVHRLAHGTPLHPLPSGCAREFSDYGASVALWGTTIDQFYTGGSDGLLKQWDIRRSPADALVADVVSFNEGITSGTFSADKTHILIGAHGGGIRVVSCAPSDPENEGFKLKDAPEPPVPEMSGREASKDLVSKGEIVRHPIYGPGQGPKYKGPYARWARGLDKDTSLKDTIRVPLKDEYLKRQLDASQAQTSTLDRNILEELQLQRKVAQARNARFVRDSQQAIWSPKNTASGGYRQGYKSGTRSNDLKRKINLDEDLDEKMFIRERKRSRPSEVIDLTLESPPRTESTVPILHPSSTPTSKTTTRSSLSPSIDLKELEELEELDQDSEDDYWWPDSGCYDANICDSD